MKHATQLLMALAFVVVAYPSQARTRTPAAPLPPAAITLHDFQLTADLTGDHAAFVLSATAHAVHSKGGSIELLSGALALTDPGDQSKSRIRAEEDRYIVAFDRAGKFPIQIRFIAAVRASNDWKSLEFQIAPATVQPIVIKGLGADAQLHFAGAARPERRGDDFVSYLPPNGVVNLAWKEARPAAEGKLFYSAEMLSQISVSPGLMRQIALFDFKVMQGELHRATFLLRGAGEVTRVQGDHVLAWSIEPDADTDARRLIVQFNQPQKDQFKLQVQTETPLGAFPQTTDAIRFQPDAATRLAGHIRVVNQGAVRLEVAQARELSQISPEQFPEAEPLRPTGNQRFVYRFSGADYALRVHADQILPELAVSQLLAYRLGENEIALDAEIELDIREAPLRELTLRLPKGFAIAQLSAPELNDYFLRDAEDESSAELRLVYGQPVSGRQLVQLRIEQNKVLGETTWQLPRLDVLRARTVRGHVAASADAGLRLTAERTDGLTEIATAFFPRKLPGIQAAFRMNDAAWQAALRVERLPQTVQADALHLFSIGEGIAYGSSVINYVISGAPVQAFAIELSGEYSNVEFTGKDIRNWQKSETGYTVQLHTPVSGAYPLLATYERPFKPQGGTLAFTGARPLDAQSEQGHTLVISAYQFQVKAVEVSSSLLALETGEVPPEYRLFFDAPVLAAYRYTSRSFHLQLALSPLAQGDSLSQIVDRATLTTRVAREGQVLTDARYFLKNRGNPHLRLSVPAGTQLWAATVNGFPVVPIVDGAANLIPLPQQSDPNAVLALDLTLAARANDAKLVNVAAPILDAPVMLAEWKLEPDTNRRLIYRGGTLTPAGGIADASGFAAVTRLFTGAMAQRAWTSVIVVLTLLAAALIVWRWTAREAVDRFSGRHLAGIFTGLVALGFAVVAFISLLEMADQVSATVSANVVFVAPVQQAGSALAVQVENVEERGSVSGAIRSIWPVFFALGVWAYAWHAEDRQVKLAMRTLGWLMLAWVALRMNGGAGMFLAIIAAFTLLHAVVPALRQLWQLATGTKPEPGGAASAATALALLASVSLCGAEGLSEPACAESVVQDVRVEENFAFVTAKVRWRAAKGEALPLFVQSAVLTGIHFPANALTLLPASDGSNAFPKLLAQRAGVFDIEVRFQAPVTTRGQESGFFPAMPRGLVNRLNLTIASLDVDVSSPQAVSVQRESTGGDTVASLVLAPGGEGWIGWKPRIRDVRREKPVFYTEMSQLYAPAAGVIEGAHHVSIRPAQGELNELVFHVPNGATITDVTGRFRREESENANASTPASEIVSLWRFDPDTRKLRVTLTPAQSRPFALLVRSQTATGPLPFEQSLGLLVLEQGAGQIGLLGIATGNDVQLDSFDTQMLSPINLEDFPTEPVDSFCERIAGLTVRRAFRYTGTQVAALLRASAVEPDVRVETQDTLSLGEDRTVLAANAAVEITRAGIFRLSFVPPAGFDVESISGAALSHWTEVKTETERVITLHLIGKTEGKQRFAVTLAGPGVKAAQSWPAPQLIWRDAGKQRGTLLVIPEQGLRLQAAARDGVTQLDPQKSGIRQKGVLSFRILQTPWNLALDIDQVAPWIQVSGLQHATVADAQVKIVANLQYQIENTGLKAFRVLIPTNAENLRFYGEQVADFLPSGAPADGLQPWEVKLHRRVMGAYLLQVTYQTPLPEQAAQFVLRGIQAADVNLQRGYVTVQSGGRLQLRADAIPALQPAEWQGIPRALQRDLPSAAATFAYRLVEPAFELPLRLERHEAAKLLPARVENVLLTSVVSDDGILLTRAQVTLLTGDKRLLHLRLPAGARFWFAFVNQNGVWPWRENDEILLPLEQPSRKGAPLSVEIFYSCRAGSADARSLDLELLAPTFDLPLENITWRVALNDKWKLKNWDGSLELQNEEVVTQPAALDLQTYLQSESAWQHERTRAAEHFLAAANTALEQGDPHQARRAFRTAYGLSTHDAAFNEDARVQLHNVKLQQALVGLNVRQASVAGEPGASAGRFRELRAREAIHYTQQDARALIERNTADDHAALLRLAERLIQQQDAAVSSPATLRASVPEQGRVLTFTRAMAVDAWEDLDIRLRISAAPAAPAGARILILFATLLTFGAFATAGFRMRHGPARN